ncbi:MAG: hypothetical protein R2867_42145 [Caldilineaceae bacterium]
MSKHRNHLYDTGNPAVSLLAAIVRVAVQDSRLGESEAIAWLDEFFPEWRKIENNKRMPKAATDEEVMLPAGRLKRR